MLLVTNDVLTPDDILKVTERLSVMRFVDGATTAG